MSDLTIEFIEEDEYEEWQYEKSGNEASDFISKEIIPKLEEFDFGSDDKDYVKGMAHYALFIELLPKLGQLGYTPDDLVEFIEELVECGNNRILH